MTSPSSPPAPPARPSERRGSPAGLVSVILVGVALLLQLINAITSAVILSTADDAYQLYGFVGFAFLVLQGIAALAAAILGGVGLAARDRPRLLAALGTGGAAVVLFGILMSLLSSALLSVSI